MCCNILNKIRTLKNYTRIRLDILIVASSETEDVSEKDVNDDMLTITCFKALNSDYYRLLKLMIFHLTKKAMFRRDETNV